MAYFNNEDENQNAQGMNAQKTEVTDASAPKQLSTGVGATSSGPVPTGSQSQPSAPKATSSGMTGFQNYQKANQGTATNNLAGAASGNVNNLANTAKTNINQATTSFGQKVDQGTIANKDNAVNDVKSAVNAARQLSAGSNLGQDQTSRFQEVINAKYQGPESLRQSGDYNKAQQATNTAQTAIDQTKSAQGREAMLRNMYANSGNYTQGLNKLDAGILNASQQGVQNLQNTAKAQGNIQNTLDNAAISAANLAQNRTNEVNQIRTDARNAFTEGKTAEEKATEDRITAMTTAPVMGADGKPVLKADGSVLTQWEQLPEYFKNIIRNKTTNNQTIYNDQLTKLKADTNYDSLNNQYAQALSNRDNINKTISGLYGQLNALGGGATWTPAYKNYKNQMANLINQLNSANSALNNIAQQKSAVDSQISDLQQSYNPNAVNFNSAEAAILGLNNGEGLYNLGADAIKVGQADRERLISKDEQARQAALASLGALDNQGLLDTNLKYKDASKAGTQSALDALDLTGTRAGLNEAEKNFQNYAQGADLTGYGSKKNKTNGKRYYAQESANLGDLLSKAGYNFGGTDKAYTGNSDILKAISNVSNTSQLSNDAADLNGTTGAGAATGDGLSLSGSTNPVNNYMNFISSVTGLNALTGALGLGQAPDAFMDAQGKYNPVFIAGDTLGRNLGLGNVVSNIGSKIFGGGANTAESKADAAQFARNDLQNKVQNAIDSSGFQNRANIVNNNTTTSRLSSLQQLLANLDKTNR